MNTTSPTTASTAIRTMKREPNQSSSWPLSSSTSWQPSQSDMKLKPMTSSRRARALRIQCGSWMNRCMSHSAKMPTGTLMKKIQRQL